jgi:hypothetical protein
MPVRIAAKQMNRRISHLSCRWCRDNQVVFGAVNLITPEKDNLAGMEGRQRGTVPFVKSHCAKSGATTKLVALNVLTLLCSETANDCFSVDTATGIHVHLVVLLSCCWP